MLKKISEIFKKKSKKDELENLQNSINNFTYSLFVKHDISKELEEYIVEYTLNKEQTINTFNEKKIQYVVDSIERIQLYLNNYLSNTSKIEHLDIIIRKTKEKNIDLLSTYDPLLLTNSYYNGEITEKINANIDKVRNLIINYDKDKNNESLCIAIQELDLENKDNVEIAHLFNIRDFSAYLYEFERDKNQLLIDHLNELKKNILSGLNQLSNFFDANDIDNIIKYFNTRLSAIPYEHFKSAKESFYNAILGIILFENQINYIDQKHNNIGRSDLIVERKYFVYCLELKLNKSTDEALKQIIDRDYLGEYRLHNKKLIGIGINISSTRRQIDGKHQDIL